MAPAPSFSNFTDERQDIVALSAIFQPRQLKITSTAVSQSSRPSHNHGSRKAGSHVALHLCLHPTL